MTPATETTLAAAETFLHQDLLGRARPPAHPPAPRRSNDHPSIPPAGPIGWRVGGAPSRHCVFHAPRRHGNTVRPAQRGGVMAEPAAAVSDPRVSGSFPSHGAKDPFLCFSLGAALAAGGSGVPPSNAASPGGAWRVGASAAAARGATVSAESKWRGPATRLQVTARRSRKETVGHKRRVGAG